VLTGDLTLLAAAVAATGAIMGWRDLFESRWLAHVEARYVHSRLVTVRLRARDRRRRRLRRVLPRAATTGRVSGLVCALIAGCTFLAAVMGWQPPRDPSSALILLRITAHAAFWVALTSTLVVLVGRGLARDWDRAAESPLCVSPLVTGAELAEKLSREEVVLVARLLVLAPLLTLWVA
jgi:hypothetical protein